MTSEHEPHDPFARLRNADPAADRRAAPSIAPLLERLEDHDAATPRETRSAPPGAGGPGTSANARGTALGRAVGGRRRRRQLAVVLAATVLVVAAALGAVGLLGRGPGGLDVVARARAALVSHGEILHVATRTTRRSGGAGGAAQRTTVMRTERWSAEAPARLRATRQLLAGPRGPGPVYVDDYAGRTFRSTSSDSRDLHVTVVPRRLAPVMAAQRLAVENISSLGMMAGADPVRALRRMLDDGRVHAAGEVELHGRRLLRLVYRPRAGAAERGTYFRESADRGSLEASFPIEYLVDAETFAPVRVSYGRRMPNTGQARPRTPSGFATTIVFEAYERLPLTAENERLLRIDPSGLDVVRDPRSSPVVRRVRPLRARPEIRRRPPRSAPAPAGRRRVPPRSPRRRP